MSAVNPCEKGSGSGSGSWGAGEPAMANGAGELAAAKLPPEPAALLSELQADNSAPALHKQAI
jgi:hypothetical protein